MADDLPLTVPWRSIHEFFSCPVCLCNLSCTHVTPCGHRYCEKCIKEWVDRHHNCPCCNATIQQTDLIRDPQYDALIGATVKEKEVSEKKYFDRLINSGTETSANPDVEAHLSPIEAVLKKHLKESLSAHIKYFQEFQTEYDRRLSRLEMEHRSSKDNLYTEPGLSGIDINVRMERLQEDVDQQKNSLQQDHHRCVQHIAEAFDRYLSEHIPSMSILPITVSIGLLSKSQMIPDVQLKPQHSLAEIKDILVKHMEGSGDQIISFGSDVKFLIFGPFAKRSLYEMHCMATDILEHGASHSDITVLPAECTTVLQMAMKPGSVIAVYGQVKCASDLPKKCFVSTFQASQSMLVDYFTCTDCNINWVCRSCMESCHKDHRVKPYIMNHQPTWACCYCPKKKKCRLVSA